MYLSLSHPFLCFPRPHLLTSSTSLSQGDAVVPAAEPHPWRRQPPPQSEAGDRHKNNQQQILLLSLHLRYFLFLFLPPPLFVSSSLPPPVLPLLMLAFRCYQGMARRLAGRLWFQLLLRSHCYRMESSDAPCWSRYLLPLSSSPPTLLLISSSSPPHLLLISSSSPPLSFLICLF